MMPLLSLVACVALAGCAHGGIGGGTAMVALPAGDVHIDVVGERDIGPKRVDGTGFRALLVRMTLDNHSAQPWTVRPQEQVAHLGAFGPSLPADVSTEPVTVPPGQARVVELYYPMPRPDYGTYRLKQLTLDWRVRMPGAIIARRSNLDTEWNARRTM